MRCGVRRWARLPLISTVDCVADTVVTAMAGCGLRNDAGGNAVVGENPGQLLRCVQALRLAPIERDLLGSAFWGPCLLRAVAGQYWDLTTQPGHMVKPAPGSNWFHIRTGPKSERAQNPNRSHVRTGPRFELAPRPNRSQIQKAPACQIVITTLPVDARDFSRSSPSAARSSGSVWLIWGVICPLEAQSNRMARLSVITLGRNFI